MFVPALAGSDAAYYFGSVCDGLFGVKGSFFAGEPLHQNARVFVD